MVTNTLLGWATDVYNMVGILAVNIYLYISIKCYILLLIIEKKIYHPTACMKNICLLPMYSQL